MVVVKIVRNAGKKKKMMNNVAYSEMKLKVLITKIEKRLDKNQKDYWIIRTLVGPVPKSFIAFSTDYNLSEKTAYLLMNFEKLINQTALLTIKKKDEKEKVIEIELDKQ